MKRFVEGADRGQSTLLPECLEDWIDEENPVRVIDAFVDALDLGDLGFDGVEPAATGRPGFHPSVLLKLYIYGYLNRVQSSRRLEREAGRNVELLWLLGRLVPDHKTIADFRKDNGLGLRQVCARFVELCRELGLLATRERRHRRMQVQGGQQSRQQLHEGQGGAAPCAAGGERRTLPQPARDSRPAGADGGACRQGGASEGEAGEARRRDEAPRTPTRGRCWLRPISRYRSPIPTAARWQRSGRGSGVVGYNVQVAVETENHLIVTHEVTTSGSDRSQLARVGKAAKAGFSERIRSKPLPIAATSTARRYSSVTRPASRSRCRSR